MVGALSFGKFFLGFVGKTRPNPKPIHGPRVLETAAETCWLGAFLRDAQLPNKSAEMPIDSSSNSSLETSRQGRNSGSNYLSELMQWWASH